MRKFGSFEELIVILALAGFKIKKGFGKKYSLTVKWLDSKNQQKIPSGMNFNNEMGMTFYLLNRQVGDCLVAVDTTKICVLTQYIHTKHHPPCTSRPHLNRMRVFVAIWSLIFRFTFFLPSIFWQNQRLIRGGSV